MGNKTNVLCFSQLKNMVYIFSDDPYVFFYHFVILSLSMIPSNSFVMVLRTYGSIPVGANMFTILVSPNVL